MPNLAKALVISSAFPGTWIRFKFSTLLTSISQSTPNAKFVIFIRFKVSYRLFWKLPRPDSRDTACRSSFPKKHCHHEPPTSSDADEVIRRIQVSMVKLTWPVAQFYVSRMCETVWKFMWYREPCESPCLIARVGLQTRTFAVRALLAQRKRFILLIKRIVSSWLSEECWWCLGYQS